MRDVVLALALAAATVMLGCPDGSPADDDDVGDDDIAGDDDTTEDDTPMTFEECMDETAMDFSCETWVMETAVNAEEVACLGSATPTAEAFLTFWMADNEPDGSVHVLELRLQDPGWSTNNDGNRWTITLDPPLVLGDGDSLPAVLTGTAVFDVFTMAASFSFLQAELDVEVHVATPLTTQQLIDGAILDATLTGTGSDFLVFDGTDDSPDPLGDYEWVSDPSGEAFGCIHTEAMLHPLEVGEP